LDRDAVETTYVIRLAGEAIGAAHLMPVGAALEAGVWLAPRYRGEGLGKIVVARLTALAWRQGAAHVVASTTRANHAAQAVLRHAGASLDDAGDGVTARIDLRDAVQ
jgi:RimJ/RimL family protein N-acetyltransferase